MRDTHNRDHHHPARLIRGLLVALAALVAASAAAAAGHVASLPSPAAPLSPSPPLNGGATASAENVRHRVSARTRIEVAVDARGTPFRVVATQRLDVRVLGDYFFTIGAPVLSVTAAPGSASQPGARTTSIDWAGFDPGRRILAARARLDAAATAPSLPLRVTVEHGATVLTNATGVDVGGFAADAKRKPLLAYLESLRAAVAHQQLPFGGTVTVLTTPVPQQVHVVAPLRVEGTIGERHISLVLRDRASFPGTGRVRLTVAPVETLSSRDVSSLGGRALLAYVMRASLTLARSRQYDAFLGNPDPTGHSATTFVYRTTKHQPPAAAIHEHHRSSVWTTLFAVAGVLAVLALALVAWVRS